MKNKGSCLCGETIFLLKGKPEGTAVCHCDDCKKLTSSAFSIVAGYKKENVEFLAKTHLKLYTTIVNITHQWQEQYILTKSRRTLQP